MKIYNSNISILLFLLSAPLLLSGMKKHKEWYENSEKDRKKIALQIIHDRLEKKTGLNEPMPPAWYEKPLHTATRYDTSGALVSQLLTAGADPNALDAEKNTPLHMSCGYHISLCNTEALLAHKADVNQADNYLRTPLLRVIWYIDPLTQDFDNEDFEECKKVIKILLAHGANTTVKDVFGNTPFNGFQWIVPQVQRKQVIKLIEGTILAMRRRKAALFIAAKGKNPGHSASPFNYLPNDVTRTILDLAYPGTPWPQWQELAEINVLCKKVKNEGNL